jgi:hypothetical protein
VGLRGRIRRLERASEREMIAIPQRDDTVRYFPEGPNGYELYAEVLVHEADRWRRHYDGLEPGPAHPFVEALRNAAPGFIESMALSPAHVYRLWLDQEAIYRGEREGSGPQVRVTRPGLYE